MIYEYYRLFKLADKYKGCVKLESNSNLKANLFYLDNGYYLSKNDPLFWKKLLQRQADNGEAMFHVGMDAELEAKKYLEKFYTTRVDKYLILYRKAVTRSFNLVKHSFNKGFVPARLEALRIEREMKLTEKKISEITKPARFSTKQIILLFITAIILSVLGAFLFLPFEESRTLNYSNHNYTYMLPYEIIEMKPNSITFLPKNQSVIIIPEKDLNREKLVNELVGKLKIEYELNPRTAKQVLAMDEKSNEIGMAVWEGGDRNIQVYIYLPDNQVAMNNKERQLWETATVVRSALYQFVKENGYMPKDLKVLGQAFPYNYLTELPKEPYELKNAVTTFPTRDGGWLFSLVELSNEKDLVSVVKDALKPNLLYDKDIPFMPLSIAIDKESNSLSVISEDKIIRNYKVALGKADTTPEGILRISKKVVNPDKNILKEDNVYGTRAMELSNMNYAIHGTNTPATIGENVSQGCIRLNNSDMEELYAMIPLNTAVEISKNLSLKNPKEKEWILYSPNKNLYNSLGDPMEEDLFTKYHWAN